MVEGDRDELLRVFENLVENALKYGASGKRVRIVCGAKRRNRRHREAVVYGAGFRTRH